MRVSARRLVAAAAIAFAAFTATHAANIPHQAAGVIEFHANPTHVQAAGVIEFGVNPAQVSPDAGVIEF